MYSKSARELLKGLRSAQKAMPPVGSSAPGRGGSGVNTGAGLESSFSGVGSDAGSPGLAGSVFGVGVGPTDGVGWDAPGNGVAVGSTGPPLGGFTVGACEVSVPPADGLAGAQERIVTSVSSATNVVIVFILFFLWMDTMIDGTVVAAVSIETQKGSSSRLRCT